MGGVRAIIAAGVLAALPMSGAQGGAFTLEPGESKLYAAFFSPLGRDSLDERGGTLGIGVRF